jgi:hypothetical protein
LLLWASITFSHQECHNYETKVNQVKEEKENPSLQIKVGRMLREFDEKKTKHILQHLQTQRKKWCLHNINAFCCFFIEYCVYLKVNLDVLQMMLCLLCHYQPVFFVN